MGMRCSQREYRADATLLPRELQREKVWSRIHLVPLLLAEGDRDAYRRQQAALEREREIMKDVPGWEVSDILSGQMTEGASMLTTWSSGVVPSCGSVRCDGVRDRLARAYTTIPDTDQNRVLSCCEDTRSNSTRTLRRCICTGASSVGQSQSHHIHQFRRRFDESVWALL